MRLNFSSLIIFCISLAFSDYLRAKLFTGFPWNLWAYSTSWIIEVVQVLNHIGLYAYNLLIVTIFTFPIIIVFKISTTKKILSISLSVIFILSLYIYGNYLINKNEKMLADAEKKILVKVISPNFELKYGLNKNEIEERLNKLIKYSDPDKDSPTLFIWPEGVFSGYSYSELSNLKNIFKKNFSKKHYIILGSNKLERQSMQYFNSMLVLNNNFEVALHRWLETLNIAL